MKIYKILGTKKLPDSQVEITAEIPTAALATYTEKAFKNLSAIAEMPGFRKGHVPEAKLREKIGEIGLLEDAGEMAINDSVAEILLETKTSFLGRPEIKILKIAIGSALEFSITATVMPEVKLPDYKKIATKENAKEEKVEEVTDEQLEKTIEEIRTMYARQNHTHAAGESHAVDEKLDLPEINDEFVKKLGTFENIADFRAKLKDNIAEEKRMKARDKKRSEILEALVAKSAIELPNMLVESELDKMEGQFKADIAHMGLQPEDYLTHIKKTWEDLRKEWRPDAEKRAKTQLILQKISLEEKIEVKKEDIEKESKHLLEHYKDADPERIRAYVEMIMVNEAVIKFLEEQK